MKTSSFLAQHMVSLESDTYLTIEEFSQQQDDYIIETLQKEFLRLQEAIEQNKLTKPANIIKNSVCKSILERIETLIVDRFGVQIKFVAYNDDTTLFKTLLLPPTTLDISKLDLDNTNATDSILKEISSIEDSWNLKGVSIDNNAIKISGLPKDYDIIIMSNFTLMNILHFTDIDMAILLINEIGKIFHYLRLSYKPLGITKEFYTEFRNLITNKNMDAKRALSTAYVKITGDRKLDVSENNIFTATVIIFRKFTSYIMNQFKNFDGKSFIKHFTMLTNDNVDKYLETRHLLNEQLNTILTVIILVAMIGIFLYICYIILPFLTALVYAVKLLALFILGGILLYILHIDRTHNTNNKKQDTLDEIKDILKSQTNNIATSTISSTCLQKLNRIKICLTKLVDTTSGFSSFVLNTMFKLAGSNEINVKELEAVENEIKK